MYFRFQVIFVNDSFNFDLKKNLLVSILFYSHSLLTEKRHKQVEEKFISLVKK